MNETQLDAVLAGNQRALARLLTQVENRQAGINDTMAALYSHTGQARVVGVTGAPGTGKSSLVNALARVYRRDGLTVGILAVDPTSPFSGGAILGDRIRMGELSGDRGAFIRSMATRGSLGGLAHATRDAVRVLDAAGFDVILIETVGAGQSEIDIVLTAQTTVVVEAPGLGDDVQAIKAGILEIADVLVVNKADRPGAKRSVQALNNMIGLGHRVSRLGLAGHHGALMQMFDANSDLEPDEWVPPVLQTIATEESGIVELQDALASHEAHLQQYDRMARLERQRIAIELYDRLRYSLMDQVLTALPNADLSSVIERVRARQLDPQGAVQTILSMYDQHSEKLASDS